jgi:hypothetical protein
MSRGCYGLLIQSSYHAPPPVAISSLRNLTFANGIIFGRIASKKASLPDLMPTPQPWQRCALQRAVSQIDALAHP